MIHLGKVTGIKIEKYSFRSKTFELDRDTC